ncbi:MAG: hypothetical protein GXY58_19505 [Planctomycetaceae bacterium]|nr:hypothetical protein [Planctomycetaceae bacterium]
MAITRCPQCRRTYPRGGRCLALKATWSEAERRGRMCGAYRSAPVETHVVERVGDGMRGRDMEGLGCD